MFCNCLLYCATFSTVMSIIPDRNSYEAFSNSLSHIVNRNLGVLAVQTYLDNIVHGRQYATDHMDVDSVKLKLAISVKKKYDERIVMVKRLRDYMLQALGDGSIQRLHSIPECSNITHRKLLLKTGQLKFTTVFNTEVALESMCNAGLSENVGALDESVNRPTAASLYNLFHENRVQFPKSAWQHIHLEETSKHILYPYAPLKTRFTNSKLRLYPWYSKATTGATDVVIAIDRSMGMTGEALETAKTIAKHIIKRHSLSSRITVLAFSDELRTAGTSQGCFAKRMAKPNLSNKYELLKFINHIKPGGMSVYVYGYATAIDILSPQQEANRTKIAVLLTGVQNSDSSRWPSLAALKRSHRSNATYVHLVTIGVGQLSQGLSHAISSLAYNPIPSNNPLSLNIQNDSNLHQELEPFYKYLTLSMPRNNYTISHPYRCPFSKDVMWTVTMPLFYHRAFVGIVAIDMLLYELLDEISYFEQTPTQYIFIVHQREHFYLYHPKMPRPTELSNTVNIDIRLLERYAFRRGIMDEIINGINGSKRIRVQQTRSRGNAYKDGTVSRTHMATYHWYTLFGLPITVCLVDGGQSYINIFVESSIGSKLLSGNIQYQRKIGICKYFGLASLVNESTIVFSAAALNSPIDYMRTEQTVETLMTFQKMLSGEINNTFFKRTVIEGVKVSNVAHDYWINSKMLTATHRYIALASGVLRVHPGMWSNKSFHAPATDWYKKSAAHPRMKLISTPHLDRMGAGYIITLSKALTLRIGGRRNVFGVMAIDFRVQHFGSLLMRRFSHCKDINLRCIAMDSSGYVIYHEDMEKPPGMDAAPTMENIHITEIEPDVASYLINEGLLLQVECHRLLTMRTYLMYNMNRTETVVKMLGAYPFFEMSQILNSNVYILTVRRQHTYRPLTTVDLCRCNKVADWPRCGTGRTCVCPCMKLKRPGQRLQHCKPLSTTSRWASCAEGYAYEYNFLTPPQYASRDEEFALLQQLPSCYSYECDAKSNLHCTATAGCTWCIADTNGTLLSEPFCAKFWVCYYGQIGHSGPYNEAIEVQKELISEVSSCGPWCSVAIVAGVFGLASLTVASVIYVISNSTKLISKPVSYLSKLRSSQSTAAIKEETPAGSQHVPGKTGSSSRRHKHKRHRKHREHQVEHNVDDKDIPSISNTVHSIKRGTASMTPIRKSSPSFKMSQIVASAMDSARSHNNITIDVSVSDPASLSE